MTQASKAHADGGTYVVLQLADTRERWAIALTEWTTYKGALRYEVLRVSPDKKTIRLSLHNEEKPARAAANIAWKRDR